MFELVDTYCRCCGFPSRKKVQDEIEDSSTAPNILCTTMTHVSIIQQKLSTYFYPSTRSDTKTSVIPPISVTKLLEESTSTWGINEGESHQFYEVYWVCCSVALLWLIRFPTCCLFYLFHLLLEFSTPVSLGIVWGSRGGEGYLSQAPVPFFLVQELGKYVAVC